MKSKITKLILGLLLYFSASSQHRVFTSYTVSDGLTNNAIRKVYQDPKGYLWICTWEGLNKYDGHQFTGYTIRNGLPHSMVNDVIGFGKDKLLVAMNDGSLCFIENGQISKKKIPNKFTINKLIPDSRHGLLGTTDRNGLVKVDSNGVERRTGKDSFSFYTFVKAGLNYFAIGDPSPVTVYDKDLNKISQMPRGLFSAQSLWKDSNGRIWIGTSQGLKLLQFSGEKIILAEPPAPFNNESLRSASIWAIYEDASKNLWFGTYSGLVKVSPEGGNRVFTIKDGLPGNFITCITEDREKNLWIGTYSGLAKLPFQSVNVIETRGHIPITTGSHSLHPISNENLMVVSSNGIYEYNIQQNKFTNRFTGVYPGSLVTVKQSGRFSFAYQGSIYSYDEEMNKYTNIEALKGNYYFFDASCRNRNFAFAGLGVFLLFKDSNVKKILDSIRMNNIIWDDQGVLWAGSWEDGLFRIEIDTIKNDVRSIESFQSLAGESIRALHVDKKGNLWVGTRYNGIYVLPGDNDKKRKIKTIRVEDGLMSNWIYCFSETSNGYIWVGTLTGISKIISQDTTYQVLDFSRSTNLYTAITSLVTTPDDQLWGTSEKGLVNFTDHRTESQLPLPVEFTDIRLGKTDSNFALMPVEKTVQLSFRENKAKFEFTSLGFINEKELQYSYRLKGSSDTTWSIPKNIHIVEYPSLKAGSYTFEVRMKGWNGEYGPISSFPFVIRQPYWQTWWFYLSLAVLATFIIYAFYRYRIRNLVRLQRVRNSIATDLHDDIGSTLTNINILSQLTMDKITEPENARNFLERIKSEVLSSGQALDDIIWSVNSRNDSYNETIARMRRFAADLFDNSNTKCHLVLNEETDGKKINMELRRDLYMIYKESMNNIHKHACAKNVWVEVQKVSNTIRLRIRDDGKGFNTQQNSTRNGLKNVKFRVEKWNGEFEYDSSPGEGTRIEVGLPV